jgi:hypothetical protein
MDKLRIQEIIAQGRIRNLSDEQIAEEIVKLLEEKKNGKKQPKQQEAIGQPVDSVGN